MRNSRRDLFISSARVAYHYNYTLKEALELSISERNLLVSIAMAEKEADYVRLEETLGTRVDVDSLLSSQKQSKDDLAKYVRLPMLPMVAPEIFKHMTDELKNMAVRRKSVVRGVSEVGTLSAAEAKAFFKNLTKG